MKTFRTETQIDATPDAVFAYVTDFGKMHDYLPTVDHAEPAGEGKIEMDGEADGHHYDATGWFEKDDAERTMEWGSDGQSVYSGHLSVRETPSGSLLEIMLTFGAHPDEEATFESSMETRGPAIQEGLDKSVEAVKANVEGVPVSDGAYVV
ncbi:hypothetical protein BH11ARM2_BH11ARM2_04350 [soil metagenome]